MPAVKTLDECPMCLTGKEHLEWRKDECGWNCLGCGSLITEEAADAVARRHDQAELTIEAITPQGTTQTFALGPLDELEAP